MTEEIDQHHSVNASVRMVADGDERAVRKRHQALRMQNFILHTYILQHRLGESRTTMQRVPVIQVIDLVYSQRLHQKTRKGVARLSAEGRSDGFQIVESKKRHSSHFCLSSSKLCDKTLWLQTKNYPNRRRFLPQRPIFAIFERLKYRTL